MSWDQQPYSFGNPNAQPPTPTQTPTSAQFPSPTFQTPQNNSNFENRSGWTPTFAEEYSVFNSTPGRLTSSQHNFAEASTPRPSTASTQNRRLSTADDITAELASHVHHFSPNPGLTLPPVDPSNQLPSSPGPYSVTNNRFDDSTTKKITPKKPKKRLEEAFGGQTATPPASASKGSRKLAPKISTDTMQNDSQDGHYGNSHTSSQQPNIIPFPPSSAEFFYPMSAPATAPTFTNTKPYWDPDASMSGMDLDFTTDIDLFNASSHRISNSFDWSRNNQMFQDTVNVSQHSHPAKQPTTSKRQRPLAPKLPRTTAEMVASIPPFDFNSGTVSDDPFSVATLGGGVDPGLLFSQSNSLSVSSGFEDVSLPTSRPVTSHLELKPYQHQLRESQRDEEESRRSRSSRETGKARRMERGSVSSPIKSSARPGLQRSVSDNKGKRPQGKFNITTASGARVTLGQDRIISRAGRISPVKNQLPISLTSISEISAPMIRTEVKFTIDANGRARTETVVVEEDAKTTRGEPPANEEGDLSQYESSSDDEPILLPSRNSSFALPPQTKAPKLGRFETGNRGSDLRRRSTGYSQLESLNQRSMRRDSIESETETVMEGDDGSGDATLELRKILEERKKNQLKPRNPRHHRYISDNIPRGSSQYIYSSSTNISPTTITDPDGATPSSSRSGTTRCVCNNNTDSEGFMIQCESCDNWLHSKCVGIDQRSLPPVYICAFCAQTPNMRGGRIRDPSRASTQLGSSPLAHKSFKSFR